MKTFFLLWRTAFANAVFTIGLQLYICVIFVCFHSNSYAAGAPAHKNHKKHSGYSTTGKPMPADVANTKTGIFTLPSIGYSSPQIYYAGTAITSLVPANSGGAVATPAYNNLTQTLASGVSSPIGVAVDAEGNVYVALRNNTTITKIPFGGGAPVQIGSGFATPYGVAVDVAGNVYVADYGSNSVKKILASDGSTITIGTGFSNPNGVAVDVLGNVYVSDTGNDAIKEIPVGGGAQLTLGSGFSLPFGVAVDAAGNVYVCDAGASLVKKIPAGGGAPITLGSGFSQPDGLTVDAAGNVFVADAGNNAVKEIPVTGGSPISLASGLNGPQYVAIDGAGDVFVTDNNNSAVKKILPSGGYYLNTALPPGLAMDGATGIISGTPTLISPSANYAVTAYNSSGSASTTLNIAVTGPLPVISYHSPQSYVVNVPITSLTPTSSAVSPAAYSGIAVPFKSGFVHPRGIATDGAGNVFVSDFGSSLITEFPTGGGTSFTIGSAFQNPDGVAVDGQENVYVSDYGSGKIKKVLAGGSTVIAIGTGYNAPYGVAADAAGNAYVADYLNGVVRKIAAVGGATTVIGSGFSNPAGVAVDAAGNVYVADFGASTVKEILASDGSTITLGTGFSNPYGVTVDYSGNVFVADFGHSALKEILKGSGTTITIATGFQTLTGVATDNAGIVYTADYDNTVVHSFTPTGGYYISPSLPAGISIDNSTGIISGTPTKISPAAFYTVTAYNSSGSTSFSINIGVSALSLSYAGPKSYTKGAAISPLTPTSNGVGAAGYASLPTINNAIASSPYSVKVDALNNVYVIQSSGFQVTKFPAGGGSAVLLGSGFITPVDLDIDASGNIYVADFGNNAIKKIPAGNGAPVTLGSGFSGPNGVAVDAAGNVYVADTGNSLVKEIPVGGGAVITLGSGFNTPVSVAVDRDGNVYVSDRLNGAIKKIPAGNGTPVTLVSGLNDTYGVAVDFSGNVFYGDRNNNVVNELIGGAGSPVAVGSGYNLPYKLATDAAGDVYVADFGSNAIKKIVPSGGFYLNSVLPAGLNFSSATGTVSGTPTVVTPAANYTVTAYNGSGSGSSVVNIKVVVGTNANLAGLALSNGTLSPIFSASTINYTASVGSGLASITITPTTVDPLASITINGVAVTSGSASQGLPLVVGPNTFTVAITAQDGVTNRTYTVTVTRAPSINANLSALGQSAGSLTPPFTSATTSYTDNVSNATTSITLKPVSSDAHATIKVNGTAVTTGTMTAPIALAEGAQTVITTVVTAQDGTTTKTYTLTVTRAPSSAAYLGNMTIKTAALSPAFAYNTYSYTSNVANSVSSVTVTPSLIDTNGTIKVNGTAIGNKKTSGAIALAEGAQTVITVVVTAQDGVSTHSYTVTITRAPSSVATLSKLTSSSGTLSPVFAATTTGYTASVANSVKTITVTPTVTDLAATVKVNGTAVTSGTASGAIALAEGAQTVITTVVTAQDGTTTKTYTLTVTRAPSSQSYLANMSIKTATLSPAFAFNTYSYTSNVANSVSSVTVTPSLIDTAGTIKVDGTAVGNKQASGPVMLAVGQNTITVVVTAQDGVSTHTYTVTIARAAGGADSYAPIAIGTDISVTKPTGAPQLADDGIQVHQVLSPNGDGINDFLQIDNISQYPDNKLSIMNRNGQLVYEASGYDNSSKMFDGHSNKNGQMQLPGTYFYQLDYAVNGIIKHKTGFIVMKY